MVHQLLRPGSVGERTAVVVAHDVSQLVEHDLARIGVEVVLEPRLLVGAVRRTAAQTHDAVARIDQPDIQAAALAHLAQHPLGGHLVVDTAVAVETVLILAQDHLVFGHVDHVGEVQEEGHRLAAMHGPDTHPVARGTAVRTKTQEEFETLCRPYGCQKVVLTSGENGYGIPELQAVLNAAVVGEQEAE